MPDTFEDYKKQRFRWAYGAVQILRRHAAALFQHGGSGLTTGQRYHFIAGWLPWITDSANLVFTLTALLWSSAMILFPNKVDAPLVVFSMMPLTLFMFKLVKMLVLYRKRVGMTIVQAIASALAGLSLSHTVSKAILLGFLNQRDPVFSHAQKDRCACVFQRRSVRPGRRSHYGSPLAVHRKHRNPKSAI